MGSIETLKQNNVANNGDRAANEKSSLKKHANGIVDFIRAICDSKN